MIGRFICYIRNRGSEHLFVSRRQRRVSTAVSYDKSVRAIRVKVPDSDEDFLLHSATVRWNDRSAQSVDEWTGGAEATIWGSPRSRLNIFDQKMSKTWPDGFSQIVGSGEQTLVLCHGYGGSQAVWDDVLPSLSQRNQVLLFDWSFSSAVDPSVAIFDPAKYSSLDDFANDLITLLDGMNLKGVVLVGHSMSGMIGCIASVRRPDLFSHLVLVAASPRYLNAEDYKGGFEQEEIENILSVIGSNFTTWAESFTTRVMGATDPKPAEKFSRSFQLMRPETALSVAKTIFLADWRDVLERVEVPCTIVQGTNDIAAPVSVAHYMQSRMKAKAKVEIIEGDGHFPQLTSPEVLIGIIEGIFVPKKGM